MDKYTLKTIFEKSFSGLIWRMEADTDDGVIALETRNPSTGIPLFSAIRYGDGRTLMSEQAYGDRHWTLAAVDRGHLLLRAFGKQEPDGPGIACLSVEDGELLWEKFNYTFIGFEKSAVVARPHRIRNGFNTYLSLHDGEPTAQHTLAESKPAGSKIVIPKLVEGNAIKDLGYEVVGPVHHHDFGDLAIHAFHEKKADKIEVTMLLMERGMIRQARTLMSGLTKMTPEIFFIIDRQLFFIDGNKQKIVSYLV